MVCAFSVSNRLGYGGMIQQPQDQQSSFTFTNEEAEHLRMELMRVTGENAILRQKLQGEQTAKRDAERLAKQVREREREREKRRVSLNVRICPSYHDLSKPRPREGFQRSFPLCASGAQVKDAAKSAEEISVLKEEMGKLRNDMLFKEMEAETLQRNKRERDKVLAETQARYAMIKEEMHKLKTAPSVPRQVLDREIDW